VKKEKFSECCISGYQELYIQNRDGEFKKTKLYRCAKCENACYIIELFVEEE